MYSAVSEKEQGFIEYAMILILVVVIVIVILALFGPAVGGMFSTTINVI